MTDVQPALTADEWRDVMEPDVERGDGRLSAHWPSGEGGIRTDDQGGIWWRYLRYYGPDQETIFGDGEGREYGFAGRDAHRAAALCLYGQPFGFSRKDLDVLSRAAFGALGDTTESGDPDEASAAALRDLAHRIACLLPPASLSGTEETT